jgi:predicted RecA/RadA family phage recombinase
MSGFASLTSVFVHEGFRIDYTPGSAVPAGSIVVEGGIVGLVTMDIPAGTKGALCVEGVWRVPKAATTGSGQAVGTKMYWNLGAGEATPTASGNTYIGMQTAASADSDTTCLVRVQNA